MAMAWQDALMKLHVGGWDTDDIDAACEALCEACREGRLAGTEIAELTPDQVRSVLETDVPSAERGPSN